MTKFLLLFFLAAPGASAAPRVSHTHQFFLDAHTFDARKLERLDLDRWMGGRRAMPGLQFGMTKTLAPEGLLVKLWAEGEAASVERLFHGFIYGIIEVVRTKDPSSSTSPSSSTGYQNYWISILIHVKQEIQGKAQLRFARRKSRSPELQQSCGGFL